MTKKRVSVARRLCVPQALVLFVMSVLPVVVEAEAGVDPSTPPAVAYNRANDLYAQGKYAGAAELYSDLVRSGVSDGFLYYNLGNAYFKQGEIGKTILWYARARALLPRDRDVATNLDYARRVRPDKVDQPPLPPLPRALRAALLSFNLSELTLVVFAFYVLTVIALILFILARRAAVRRLGARFSLVLGVILLACVLWFGGRVYRDNHVIDCVVMARQVHAMSGPGEDYTRVMSLHEGTEATVLEEREGWYLVKLPSGLGGWIPAGSAELI